jgi:hypothetical protein
MNLSAWPGLKNRPNYLYKSSCLTTLLRATYFYENNDFAEPEVVARRTEEYLSRPEVKKLNKDEAILQASTYANLEHFYGDEDAFDHSHEPAHRYALWAHGGLVLDSLSEDAHNILYKLATEKLSREEIAEGWKLFWQIDKQIKHLVNKFEPIEEIFATYFSMICLPPEVRKRLDNSIKQAFKERGWYTAYKAFVRTCENCKLFSPGGAAFFILDRVCLILEKYDFDSVELLIAFLRIHRKYMEYLLLPYAKQVARYDFGVNEDRYDADKLSRSIDRMLEVHSIPREVYETACEGLGNLLYRLWSLGESCLPMKNEDDKEREIQRVLSYPLIVFIGHASEDGLKLYISSDPFIPIDSKNSRFISYGRQNYIDNGYIAARVIFEFLRQQISERCGFVCAFALKGKPCCGLRGELHRLFNRLPEEDRGQFELPSCARV